MDNGSPDKDSDDRLREQWFGPLIDAEPEEVAAALVAGTRRGADGCLAAQQD